MVYNCIRASDIINVCLPTVQAGVAPQYTLTNANWVVLLPADWGV